jgi:tetratricopeptide (TPR) repeat protein
MRLAKSLMTVWVLVLSLSLFLSLPSMAYVPDVGEGVCVANCPDESSTTSSGGDGGGYVAPVYVPSGPSPEQLRQQRLEKDLEEAALDAGDSGVAAYKSGDFAGAVKYFSEALEYAPDDPDLQHNLDRAKEALRQSETGRELKSAQQHGQIAQVLSEESSSMEARRVFDTGGVPAGSLAVPVNAGEGGYKEPKVPIFKRTFAITKMEWEREGLKKKVEKLQEERKKLDPVKDSVKIVEIKQKESEAENKIHFLNFSITEELRKAPEPKQEPAKTTDQSGGK